MAEVDSREATPFVLGCLGAAVPEKLESISVDPREATSFVLDRLGVAETDETDDLAPVRGPLGVNNTSGSRNTAVGSFSSPASASKLFLILVDELPLGYALSAEAAEEYITAAARDKEVSLKSSSVVVTVDDGERGERSVWTQSVGYLWNADRVCAFVFRYQELEHLKTIVTTVPCTHEEETQTQAEPVTPSPLDDTDPVDESGDESGDEDINV